MPSSYRERLFVSQSLNLGSGRILNPLILILQNIRKNFPMLLWEIFL